VRTHVRRPHHRRPSSVPNEREDHEKEQINGIVAAAVALSALAATGAIAVGVATREVAVGKLSLSSRSHR
jgi:hypothetical protein